MAKNAIFKMLLPFIIFIFGFGICTFCSGVYASGAEYTVKYWFETNATNGQYFEQCDKYYVEMPNYNKTLSGAVDSYTNAYGIEVKDVYQNYDLVPIQQKKIAADNSTVVDVFYNLKEITVILDYGDKTESIPATTGNITYFPTLPQKDGYTAIGWFMVDGGMYWGWAGSNWIGYSSLNDVRLNSSNALAGVQFYSYVESLTVIAKYTLIEYKIVLQPNVDDISIYGWAHNTQDNSYYKTYTINDSEPALPTLTQDGMEFKGWKQVETTAQNTKVYEAVWVPQQEYSYEVVVYLENINDSGFTQNVALSETLTALINSTVTVTPKEINGFAFDADMSTTSAKLSESGVQLKLYYKRNVYQVSFMASSSDLNPVIKNYKYGAVISAPSSASLSGYYFTGWQNLVATMPNHNLTIYANMVKNHASILEAKCTEPTEVVNNNNILMWVTCGILGAALAAGVAVRIFRK